MFAAFWGGNDVHCTIRLDDFAQLRCCDFGFFEVVNLGGGELVQFGLVNAKAAPVELRVTEVNREYNLI